MAHYSRLRGWVSRPTRPGDTGPNPYDSGSNRFAERHRETETALPGGLVRVDMGEPIKRLPSERLQTRVAKVEPVAVSTDMQAPKLSPPPEPRPAALQRRRREPWGLNRDEA